MRDREGENWVISAVNQMKFITSDDGAADPGTNEAELAGRCQPKFRFIASFSRVVETFPFWLLKMNDIDDAEMMTK